MTMRITIGFVEFDETEEYNRGAIEVTQSKYDSDVEAWRHAIKVAMTAAGYAPETIAEALGVVMTRSNGCDTCKSCTPVDELDLAEGEPVVREVGGTLPGYAGYVEPAATAGALHGADIESR